MSKKRPPPRGGTGAPAVAQPDAAGEQVPSDRLRELARLLAIGAVRCAIATASAEPKAADGRKK